MDDFERSAPPDCAADPAPVPEVAGYDVGRLLGRGGTAGVWLATDRMTRCDVALKCFVGPPGQAPPGPGRAADAEESVRREVLILSALDHEHLVKAHAVLRVGYANGGVGLGLVLDYAAGGSLGQLLSARGSLAAGEAVTILTPIAQALAYLHAKGFTHGDVSPGNVLFTAQGKPLLADLGVARMLADPQESGRAGTDGFHDPAPVDAVRAGLQPERDVYSLAALGWFCLTGRAPEPEPQRPPLPLLVPTVPASLADALEAGLRADRRQRPSAAELAAAIFRSVPPAPVDLSVSVHPTVVPQLLTRRSVPASARERRAARLRDRKRRSAPPADPGPPDQVPAGRSARHAAGPLRGLNQSARIRRGPGRPGPVRRGPGLRRATAAFVTAVCVAAAGVFGTLLLAGRLAAGEWAPEVRPSSVPSARHNTTPVPGTTPVPATARAVPAGLQELLAAAKPEDAVRGLAGLRSYALSTGNLGLLDQVNAPASPAAAADAGVGSRLAKTGHVLDGFETRLSLVQRRPESTAARAVVAVRVASPPYRERDAEGTVVAEAAAVGEQRLRLVLVPVDGKWRIQEILPAAGS
ncbi:serine/threonine-protein kinase [uncultured Arthrobacter sp.]|uniref:serine/threonine-protein kinase n=1 Tax=uncultured Arthrobacter sp. TaxID=114050 RepID=UPI0032180CC9